MRSIWVTAPTWLYNATCLGGFAVWVSAVIADQGLGEHNLGSKTVSDEQV